MTALPGEPPLFLCSGRARHLLTEDVHRTLSHIDGLVLDDHDENYLAVRWSGLSFTLSRIHPQNTENYRSLFCPDGPVAGAMLGVALGAHIEGGERIEPILQQYLSLAAQIASALGMDRIGWRPAELLIGLPQFASFAADYAAGGPFPALALVRMEAMVDGIKTRGLAWFCGQELEFSAPHLSQNEIVKRVVRIVNDLVRNGPIGKTVSVDGLEEGERIMLWPDEASSGARLLGKSDPR